jgi:hypothetical protein
LVRPGIYSPTPQTPAPASSNAPNPGT